MELGAECGAAGHNTSLVEPRGNAAGTSPDDYKTTFTYDAAGRPLTATDPLGHQTTWTYDPVGNLISRTDANNHTTSYAYDAANQLTSVTAPGGAVTSYTYDAVGNLLTKHDPNNHTTTFAYDTSNRLTSVTTPANRVWTFGYDANGNLTTVVDANGNATADPNDGTTTYTYNVLNRLTSISYSDGTPAVSYIHDADGNRITMSDGAGTQTYTYDALNQLTQVTRGSDSFAYQYDADGNVTQRTYPGGRQADYTYSDDEQLASVTSAGATTSYTYDVAGNLTGTDLPATNGYTETRTYDRAGRLTEVRNAKNGTALSFADYLYDAVGNPTTITTDAGTQALSYDNRDRLTDICYQSSCPNGNDPYIRYAYDTVGNRTNETRPAGTTTYSYDNADQLTSTNGPSGTLNYAFDADGNETQAGGTTLTYDLAGRVKAASDTSTTVNYAYDGDGNRLVAATGAAASQQTKFLWDINGELPKLAIERDGNETALRDYLYGKGPVSISASASTLYLLRDGLGSVLNATSASGDTEWTYTYEPYGRARSIIQNDPAAAANPVRYAGEYLDPVTGLLNLRARQYDLETGRFLEPDPLPALMTNPISSTYIYGNDNPASFTDPSGMGAVWTNGGQGCVGFLGNLKCIGKWASDPTNLADPARSSGGVSLGVCASFTLGFFVIGNAAACVTVAASLHDWPSAGVTETFGVGVGTGGVLAYGLNGEVSNAACVNQYGGPFTEAGVYGGEGVLGSGSVFQGSGVTGASAGLSGGADFTPPWLPGMAYLSHTETTTASVGGHCNSS